MIKLINKNHRTYFSWGLTFLAVLCIQCSALQELAKIQKPTLELHKVRISGISFETIGLLFDVKVQNPNPLSVTLAGFDYDFLLEGNSFLKGQQQSKLTIQSMGESSVEIPLALNFKEVYQTFKQLGNQDSSTYKIMCGLSFDLPILGPIRIPVSHEGKVPLLKLPSIKVDGLRLKKLTLSKADLELVLKIDNPNVFNVVTNALNYNFAINGQNWASGQTQNQIQIKEKSENSITIPVSLNLLSMGRTVYNMVTGDSQLNYQLDGDLDLQTSLNAIGQVKIPINRTGQFKILR